MTLEDRLVRLERQNRWMKCVAVAAIGLFVTLGQSKPPDEIRARRFTLVDDKGKQRGQWGMDKEVVFWVLTHNGGAPAVSLLSDPANILVRGKEQETIFLGVDPTEPGPSLTLHDKHGRADMRVTSKSGASLWLASTLTGPAIKLDANKLHSSFHLSTKPLSGASLLMAVEADSHHPGLMIFDADNKIVFKAP